MPNLAALVGEGSLRRMTSVYPWVSSVAWTTIQTGVNPGKHNIYDFLARDRHIANVMPGDYLAVCTAGAYGFVLSSNYNSRPRAPEVLVEGGTWRVIRQRETHGDLVRGESL